MKKNQRKLKEETYNETRDKMEAHNKKILLCVTGLSPQVITETLYALAVSNKPQWIPDEVHVITTEEGADRIKLKLLHKEEDYFNKLLQEYALPAITFNESTIHVIADKNGTTMADIRTISDNENAADFITQIVFDLTTDSKEMHVSLAGGRKTMGFYMGYALSLYGRQQDRLSHVLISSEYEGLSDFYYPTQKSKVIENNGKPLDTKKAKVTLADIPFVRLTEGKNSQLQQGKVSYLQAVKDAQQDISKLQIEYDKRTNELKIHGKTIKLGNALMALYLYCLESVKYKQQGINWRDDNFIADLFSHYKSLEKVNSLHFENFEKIVSSIENVKGKAKELEETKKIFETRKSKVNKKIIEALGERTAQPYLIQQPSGSKRGSAYGLGLNNNQIIMK